MRHCLPCFIACCVLLGACAAPGGTAAVSDTVPDSLSETSAAEIHVIRHRWHTGIVLPAALIPESPLAFLLPLSEDAPYYEIGFGDDRYYPLPREETSQTRRSMTAARAILWPTGGVMQVMALPRPPDQMPHTDLVTVSLTENQLQVLIAHIADHFALADVRTAVAGDITGQWFLPARRAFWVGHTCNTWTARALSEAEAAQWVILPRRAEPVMRGVQR
ncbi:DUF2459 domain-containing protein [Isoalcanivorax indicus]|uniref:DUF2459 domain-containing protein n=1 Tax=Isoalcanivorax indicus TaxID=2202653 RepID=UPI000DBA4827|nr:DUF2459 domain-containing protein [Isoalcanivorax indicus]